MLVSPRKILFFSLLIFIFSFIALLLKSNFYFSTQELSLWSILVAIKNGAYGFKQMIYYGPFFVVNIIGVMMKTLWLDSLLSLNAIALNFFFFTTWIASEDSALKRQAKRRLISCLLFLFNPFVLHLFIFEPLSLINFCLLIVAIKGLLIAQQGNLGRGVLLMGSMSGVLFMSGGIGLSYALVIFAIAPLFLSHQLFSHLRAGFTVLIFPTLASMLSILYIGWLYERDVTQLLFLTDSNQNTGFHFNYWLLATLISLTSFRLKKISLFSNFSVPLTLLAATIHFIVGHNFSEISYISLALMTLIFEKVTAKNISRSLVPLSLFLTCTSYYLFPFQKIGKDLKQNQKQVEHIRPWIDSKAKTLLISSSHALLSHQGHDPYVVYPSHFSFKDITKRKDLDKIELIIIQDPDKLQRGELTNIAKLYFHNPPEDFILRDSTGDHKVYSKRSAFIRKKANTKGQFDFSIFKAVKDLVIAFILLIFFIISRLYYLQKSSHMHQR